MPAKSLRVIRTIIRSVNAELVIRRRNPEPPIVVPAPHPVQDADTKKGARTCLKCGGNMWSDRCHRICSVCSRANERDKTPPKRCHGAAFLPANVAIGHNEMVAARYLGTIGGSKW